MKDPVKRRYVYLMLSIFGGIGLSVVLFFVVYRFRGVGDALNKLGASLRPLPTAALWRICCGQCAISTRDCFRSICRKS